MTTELRPQFAKFIREADGTYTVINPAGRRHCSGYIFKEASAEVRALNDSLRKMRGVDLTKAAP